MADSPLIFMLVLLAVVGGLVVLFLISVAWLAEIRPGAARPEVPADTEWDVLRTYNTPESAHLDRAMLQGCGIPVRLANEHTVGTDWMYGIAVGVELRVPQNQHEDAELLLRDARVGDASVDLEAEDWPSPESGLTCEQCGSAEVYRVRPGVGWALATVVLLGLPLFRRVRHQCDGCGNRKTFIPST